MTDRELLEMAAKAAGLAAYWSKALDEWQKDLTDPYVGGKKWNPLTDDGDALRLAVKLGIAPSFNEACVIVWFGGGLILSEMNGEDTYAATRRAIVRAAAEIGKTQ